MTEDTRSGRTKAGDAGGRPSLDDVYRARLALSQALEAWRRHVNYGDAHAELLEIERRHDELYRVEAARLGIDLDAAPWSPEGAAGSAKPH